MNNKLSAATREEVGSYNIHDLSDQKFELVDDYIGKNKQSYPKTKTFDANDP